MTTYRIDTLDTTESVAANVSFSDQAYSPRHLSAAQALTEAVSGCREPKPQVTDGLLLALEQTGEVVAGRTWDMRAIVVRREAE